MVCFTDVYNPSLFCWLMQYTGNQGFAFPKELSGIRKQNRGGWDHVISVPKFIHDSHTYIFF